METTWDSLRSTSPGDDFTIDRPIDRREARLESSVFLWMAYEERSDGRPSVYPDSRLMTGFGGHATYSPGWPVQKPSWGWGTGITARNSVLNLKALIS